MRTTVQSYPGTIGVFAERKVRSSRELADITFTGSVRPFDKISE